MKFLCEQCKAKYQIADEKAAGKTVRMKCRKCGHLIEVRAAVTETSVSSMPPQAPTAQAPAAKPTAPKAPQRPAPPRAGALATSLASAKPQKPAPPAGALAGAFKSAVSREREEESSAPFDMADLSPSDEWYVAINGVPVGPIRISEVRRKAALGAVTEDSLCWQEGLDEWRPVRSFPELAAVVREAATSGRSSLPPSAGEVRPSSPPPAPRTAAARAALQSGASAPRPPARAATAPQAAGRSNVVPITSRLATAEKLDEEPEDVTRMQPGLAGADVVADPFAAPAPAPSFAPAIAPTGTVQAQALTSETSAALLAAHAAAPAEPQRRAPPWMAIAMVAAACAFGITAGVAVFFRPPQAPTPVVVQVPGPAAAPVPTAAAPTATATATDTTSPEPSAASSAGKGPIAMGGPPKPGTTASTAAAPSKGPLDLGGLGGSTIRPTDDPGSDGPKAPGQCFSSGQVSNVIGLHTPGIRRSCWERNPTTKPAVNVSVSLTIGPDGSPQSVNASADEASVAKCVENDVRSWRFPAMGCSQQTGFSFHFVRQ